MIFICFVNLNLLIGIINVFLLKVKTNIACCCFYVVKTKEEGIPRLFPLWETIKGAAQKSTPVIYLFLKIFAAQGTQKSSILTIINIIVYRII